MPRVAIIGTRGYPSYYGGFETAIRKLAPYLVDQGWDVDVYSRPGAVTLDDPNLDPRVNVVVTSGLESKSLSTLSYGFTAALHAAKAKPDVALVMNVANGYFLGMLKRAGIPTVINVDGIEWERAKWGRLAKSMFRRGASLTAKHGDSLIFDAQEIERRWKADFGREGIFIPYGGEQVAQLPVEPGLKAGDYALIVARFVPENTVPEFFQAARTIARYNPVVIVGSSGYEGELDVAARELDEAESNVHWLGHVSDDRRLFSLWQNAGAYFHGHSVGGTNPALVQAMAAGAPVVARDTAYNREVLGSEGTFCSPLPEEIAKNVLSMLRSPGAQAHARGSSRQRAAEFYNWELVCGRYEAALRAQLKRRSSMSA